MHFYRFHILISIHKGVVLDLVDRDSISLELLFLQEVSAAHINVLQSVQDLLLCTRVGDDHNDAEMVDVLCFYKVSVIDNNVKISDTWD